MNHCYVCHDDTAPHHDHPRGSTSRQCSENCIPTKTTPNEDSWEKEFEDTFVRVDHGPDADDHDCEPDEWNDYAKMGDESDQIERVKQFLRETRTAAYDAGFKAATIECEGCKLNETDQYKQGRESALREALEVVNESRVQLEGQKTTIHVLSETVVITWRDVEKHFDAFIDILTARLLDT